MTAATALTTGLSTEALALTPAGYPGNESQIKTYAFQLGQVAQRSRDRQGDVKGIEAIALGTNWLHVLKPATQVVSSTTKFQKAQRPWNTR